MSIRVRLTIWYVLVLCLGLGIFGVALFFQTQSETNASFNRTLRDRAAEFAVFVRPHPLRLLPAAPVDTGERLGGISVWLRLVDLHGARVINPSGTGFASRGTELAGTPQSLTERTIPGFYDVGPLREYVLPVSSRGRVIGFVQLMTTKELIAGAQSGLVNSMLVVGALIVLLATVFGLFLAHLALRPVDRITRIAREIEESDLSRRVSTEVGRSGLIPMWSKNDEMAKLANTFDGMLGRLEDASVRRRRLTADAAHELSTPIASIKSGAEVALRRERSAVDYQATLTHIVDETDHLERIVNDLLLLARADAGRLPIDQEIVEVDDVCRQAARALEPLAKKRDISIELQMPDHPLLVRGDEMRLGQVFRNLIDNGLRYSPAKTTIIVKASQDSASTSGEQVVVHVQDHGSGIPLVAREVIFDRFHRLDAHPQEGKGVDKSPSGSIRPGSGLGLAICRAIVTAHGGTIRVVDPERASDGAARGSDFEVRLPVLALDEPPR